MKCANGKHFLEGIYSTSCGMGEDYVVRWCSMCGAVVVDIDYDGRTDPGGVMEMKFPRMSYPAHSNN